LLLLPNVTKTDTEAVLRRITIELGQLIIKSDDDEVNKTSVEVVLDFGMAIFPGNAPSLVDTINLADEDMYANKVSRKARAGLSPNAR
jgi:GGDEF domain-containing protein